MKPINVVILMAALGLLILACGPAATPTPTATVQPTPRVVPSPEATLPSKEPPRLEQALAMIPLEFSDRRLVFADYAASRAALGLGPVQSTEDLMEELGPDLFRMYEGAPLPPDLRVHVVNLRDDTGLDLLVTNLGAWSTDPMRRSDFLLLQGPDAAETISENLLALDYQPVEHRGARYYRLNEDNVMDMRHPLGTSSRLLNRVALVDGWFLAAPATSIMDRLIDAQVGEALTLLDSPAHRSLAEALGHGLIGGAFVTPEWVLENWNPAYNPRPVERLDRYISGLDPWGRLSPYTVGLMGYRVQGEVEELVIALYYSDPGAAHEDAAELESRWHSFHEDLTAPGPVEMPVDRHCSPMQTRVIEEDDYSVLVGACPVTQDDEPGRVRSGPMVWHTLVEFGELTFLALDVEDLRAAAEERQP